MISGDSRPILRFDDDDVTTQESFASDSFSDKEGVVESLGFGSPNLTLLVLDSFGSEIQP